MGSAIEDMPPVKDTPYWHVNVPEDQRTAECPVYLQTLKEKDIGIISTPDSQYHRDTWEEAKKKVADNNIHHFQRVPSELRRYKAFVWDLHQQYGGVLDFLLTQRLGWSQPVVPRGKPFECEDDIKILWNDWPYGVDERVVHLVVWTKFELEEDPVTGDVTDETRAAMAAYVRNKFSEVPEDRVGDDTCGILVEKTKLTRRRSFGSRTGSPSNLSRLWSTFTSCSLTRIPSLSTRSRTAMFRHSENSEVLVRGVVDQDLVLGIGVCG